MSRIVGALMTVVLAFTIFAAAAEAGKVKLTPSEAKAKMQDYEKRIAALEEESTKLEARKKELEEKVLPDFNKRLIEMEKRLDEQAKTKPAKDIERTLLPDGRTADNKVKLKEWELERAKIQAEQKKLVDEAVAAKLEYVDLDGKKCPEKKTEIQKLRKEYFDFIEDYSDSIRIAIELDAIRDREQSAQGMANRANQNKPGATTDKGTKQGGRTGADLATIIAESNRGGKGKTQPGTPATGPSPKPAPSTAASPGTTPSPAASPKSPAMAKYTIQPGDTLGQIAAKFASKLGNPPIWGKTGLVSKLFEHIENDGKLSGNPNLIYPGQVIDMEAVRKELLG